MRNIQSLCLYCGSRAGNNPAFSQAATGFGEFCAENRIRMVYGGGSVGLMGIAARAALAGGGRVVGIIPEHLDSREITMQGLTELFVVGSMHERKHRMFLESDAFVVLPGGIGTFDEFIEITTWAQLGLHGKPVVLVDIAGYWQPLLALFEHAVQNGFLSREAEKLFQVVDTIADIPAVLKRAAPERSGEFPRLL